MSQHDNLQDADGENLNATPPNTESTENTDASTEPVKQPILAGDSSEESDEKTEKEETKVALPETEISSESKEGNSEKSTENENSEDENSEDESSEDESTEDKSTEDEKVEDESTEDESTEDEKVEDESAKNNSITKAAATNSEETLENLSLEELVDKFDSLLDNENTQNVRNSINKIKTVNKSVSKTNNIVLNLLNEEDVPSPSAKNKDHLPEKKSLENLLPNCLKKSLTSILSIFQLVASCIP